MQDLLVSPSAAPSNGNIADGRIRWDVQFRRLRNSRNLQKNRARVVRLQRSIAKLGELIVERHHYCREFQSINDFILRNWGACVDAVLGRVLRDR